MKAEDSSHWRSLIAMSAYEDERAYSGSEAIRVQFLEWQAERS